MNSLAEIDKEFSNEKKGVGKVPKWLIRMVCAYILSVCLLFIIQPKAVLRLETVQVGDEDTDQEQRVCKLRIIKKKLFFYALGVSALIYVLLQKSIF